MHSFIHDTGAGLWLGHVVMVILMIAVFALILAAAYLLLSAALGQRQGRKAVTDNHDMTTPLASKRATEAHASGGSDMTTNRGYKAALGLVLLLGAGTVGIAGAQGMMGGGMHGGGEGSMMQDCPMMGGDSGGMQGMMGPGMDMSGKGMHGGMGMMQGLDLDDDQQASMRERRSEHRHQQFGRMAEMMDLREEMHALMQAERPDPDAVRELHGRMAEIHGDMMADRIRLRNDMHDMLTDEQRRQMREHMQKERRGMGDERSRDDDDHQGHHGGG